MGTLIYMRLRGQLPPPLRVNFRTLPVARASHPSAPMLTSSLSAVGFSGLSTAPLPRPVCRPACRPGAVRYGPSLNFGASEFVKLPFVQSAWNEIVDADRAMLEPDVAFFGKAETAAKLILKPDRTTEETAVLEPFLRDHFVSVQTIDTRVSNQVHHPPHAHPPPAQPAYPPRPPSDPASVSHPSAGERRLEDESAAGIGAGLWGLAIVVQKLCVPKFWAWWIVGIVISLLQWAFYVDQKASLIANARELYKKKACS